MEEVYVEYVVIIDVFDFEDLEVLVVVMWVYIEGVCD